MSEYLSLNAIIDDLASKPKFLLHTVAPGFATSTNESGASNVVAEGVLSRTSPILEHLRRVYTSDRFMGIGVLDFIPQTDQGRSYYGQATRGLKHDHAIEEYNEGVINFAHQKWLDIALLMVCCILYEVAARSQAPCQLDTLKAFLGELRVVPQFDLRRDPFFVLADHSLLHSGPPGSTPLPLMPFEDKASPEIGSAFNIDGELDGWDTPGSKREAIQQETTHFGLYL